MLLFRFTLRPPQFDQYSTPVFTSLASQMKLVNVPEIRLVFITVGTWINSIFFVREQLLELEKTFSHCQKEDNLLSMSAIKLNNIIYCNSLNNSQFPVKLDQTGRCSVLYSRRTKYSKTHTTHLVTTINVNQKHYLFTTTQIYIPTIGLTSQMSRTRNSTWLNRQRRQ